MTTKPSGSQSVIRALSENFLGNSPEWYKLTILAFLVLNPILFAIDGYIAGWMLVIEFIFTLAMALSCYPLQPGGLLAFEAVVIGMASPSTVYQETVNAFEVILLLIFMVAGIFFLKNLLLFTFTKLVVHVRSKISLSLMFSGVAAVLSAFLDALTVTAVVIAVASGFYGVYHRVACGKHFHHDDHDSSADERVQDLHREDCSISRFPPQSRDARRRRHGARRSHHAGWRATKPADRDGRWMGIHRVFHSHGTRLTCRFWPLGSSRACFSSIFVGSATACAYRSPSGTCWRVSIERRPRSARPKTGRSSSCKPSWRRF